MKLKYSLIGLMLLFCAALSLSETKQSATELDILFDSLFSFLTPEIKGARITVVPFTENAGQGSGIGESLAEFMIVRLQQLGVFTLVDRNEFERVIGEIELSQTGLIDDAATIEIGKMLSSQYLLTGSISMLFGKYRITAKVINIETTQILNSAATSIKVNDIESYSKELLGEQGTVHAALFRSLLVPGWGQIYTNHKIRGILNLSACLGALGTTGYFLVATAQAKTRKDEHLEKSKGSALDSMTTAEIRNYDKKTRELYNEYSKTYDKTVICAAITGAFWMINIADAIIAGAQARNKFQFYFSGNLLDESLETGVVVRF